MTKASVPNRRPRRPRPRRWPPSLQCHRSTPARLAPGNEVVDPRRFEPGRDVARPPPSPEKVAPFSVDLDAVPVRRLFSVLRSVGCDGVRRSRGSSLRLVRRTGAGAVGGARQDLEVQRGLAAGRRTGHRARATALALRRGVLFAFDRWVAAAPRGHESAPGTRRAIYAPLPGAGRHPFFPHGRRRALTALGGRSGNERKRIDPLRRRHRHCLRP